VNLRALVCRRKGHDLPDVPAAAFGPKTRKCTRCSYAEPVPPTGLCTEFDRHHPLSQHWYWHADSTTWELVPTNLCKWPDQRRGDR
jgi:hypothetical protein